MEKIIIYHDPLLDEIGEEWSKAVDKYYKQYKQHLKADKQAKAQGNKNV